MALTIFPIFQALHSFFHKAFLPPHHPSQLSMTTLGNQTPLWLVGSRGTTKCNELLRSIDLIPATDSNQSKRIHQILADILGSALSGIVMEMLTPYRLTENERALFQMEPNTKNDITTSILVSDSMSRRLAIRTRQILVIQEGTHRSFPVFAFYEHVNYTRDCWINKETHLSGRCEVFENHILLEGEGIECDGVSWMPRRPIIYDLNGLKPKGKIIENKCLSTGDMMRMFKHTRFDSSDLNTGFLNFS